MRRLIIWIVSVVTLVALVDITLGWSFGRYIRHHSLPGDYEPIEQVMRHNTSDILVLGSSVAINSVNTKTLEDSLHISSFNGGANGQTFPFYLTILKAVLQQPHKPKTVLLGIADYNLTTVGNGTRYNFLAPYYNMGIADIDTVMNGNSALEKVFLKSNLYRLNTIWFRILLYHFVTSGIKGENGFTGKPIPSSFPSMEAIAPDSTITQERLDNLHEFISLCKGYDIDLIIFFPPMYVKECSNPVISHTLEIGEEYGIKVWNDMHMLRFHNDSTLFYDYMHLNNAGADIYTDTIITRLRNIKR